MTGGGRAAAVAHERAEQQDLGLDASSHFATEGALHSLTGCCLEWGGGGKGGGAAFVYPAYILHILDQTFTFYSFTSPSFLLYGVCVWSNAAPAETSERGWLLGHRSPTMAGIILKKGGRCGPLFFTTPHHHHHHLTHGSTC